MKYHSYSLSSIAFASFLLLSIPSQGQSSIVMDTISFDCLPVYKIKQDRFVFTSQEDYEQSGFFISGNTGCLPFNDIDFDIDFDKNIIVGYKYQGSNCDQRIKWSAIFENDDRYLTQFATGPNHVCRDSQYRIAWFIISKPPGKFDIKFERTFKKM